MDDLTALRAQSDILDRLEKTVERLRAMTAERDAMTAERDTYLAAIRGTFRVLDARGQAPDDNAPLEVTVRRVLDALDKATAERDALAAELAALKKRIADAQTVEARFDQGFIVISAAFLPIELEPGLHALLRLEDGK